MSRYQTINQSVAAQLLDDEELGLQEVAKICCVNVQWLHERIEQEVIHPVKRGDTYYFSSATVTRIQHVMHVEQAFDADPQLAALVADLTEEVRSLKREIRRLAGG